MKKYSEALEMAYGLPEQEKAAMKNALLSMDEGWDVVDRMAFGLLGGALACAKNRQTAWEWFQRVWNLIVKVNTMTMTVMKDHDMETAEKLENMSEEVMDLMRGVEQQEQNFSQLGQILAVQFVARLPEVWMSHLGMLAKVRMILGELSPQTASEVIGLHEAKMARLNEHIQKGVFAMNSSVFRRIEEWAKPASDGFDGLVRSGYIPQNAYQAVISRFGSPWQ